MEHKFEQLKLQAFLDISQPWLAITDGQGWDPRDAECPAFIRKAFGLVFVLQDDSREVEAIRTSKRLAQLVPAFKRRPKPEDLGTLFLRAAS